MKRNHIVLLILVTTVIFVVAGCRRAENEMSIEPHLPETVENDPVDSTQKEMLTVERQDPIVINAMSYQTSQITNFNDSFKNGSDSYMARIVEINYEGRDLEHLRSVERLPNLRKLKIGSSLISVDTFLLPRSLESLNLGQNKIRHFETKGLPGSLMFLNLSLNPLEGTFEVTENMSGIVYLGVAGTSVNRVEGLENLQGEGLNIHFIQSPVDNPEEFIKLKNVNVLTFSVPKSYSDDEVNILRKAIKERNPEIKVLTIKPYMENEKGYGYIDDGT
jgi:Leucine-rich repeat (LRR) protein